MISTLEGATPSLFPRPTTSASLHEDVGGSAASVLTASRTASLDALIMTAKDHTTDSRSLTGGLQLSEHSVAVTMAT